MIGKRLDLTEDISENDTQILPDFLDLNPTQEAVFSKFSLLASPPNLLAVYCLQDQERL
jgi:hypothetical protein